MDDAPRAVGGTAADAMPALPRLVVIGEALTDFVRTGADQWPSVPGGACWNVARVASTLGVPTGWRGSVRDDLFGGELLRKSGEAELDPRFAQRVARPPLLAIVHELSPPRYFFVGSADLTWSSTRCGCRKVGAKPASTCISAASAWCGSRWLRGWSRLRNRCMRRT